jgi:chromosome condensin MukBEF ATPase and DNA-binding subunit MukB
MDLTVALDKMVFRLEVDQVQRVNQASKANQENQDHRVPQETTVCQVKVPIQDHEDPMVNQDLLAHQDQMALQALEEEPEHLAGLELEAHLDLEVQKAKRTPLLRAR